MTYSNGNCTIKLDIPTTLKAPVFIYYRLTNFYQNHRRYVKSFDQNQLMGSTASSCDNLATACDPLRCAGSDDTAINRNNDAIKSILRSSDAIAKAAMYYPCGLIANSLFSGMWYTTDISLSFNSLCRS